MERLLTSVLHLLQGCVVFARGDALALLHPYKVGSERGKVFIEDEKSSCWSASRRVAAEGAELNPRDGFLHTKKGRESVHGHTPLLLARRAVALSCGSVRTHPCVPVRCEAATPTGHRRNSTAGEEERVLLRRWDGSGHWVTKLLNFTSIYSLDSKICKQKAGL